MRPPEPRSAASRPMPSLTANRSTVMRKSLAFFGFFGLLAGIVWLVVLHAMPAAPANAPVPLTPWPAAAPPALAATPAAVANESASPASLGQPSVQFASLPSGQTRTVDFEMDEAA